MAILSSGVIHCQKHVYIFPCFIWIKNSSVWCCHSLPLCIIPTDTSLSHSMPSHVGSGRCLFFSNVSMVILTCSSHMAIARDKALSCEEIFQLLSELSVMHLKWYLVVCLQNTDMKLWQLWSLGEELFATVSQWAEKGRRSMCVFYWCIYLPALFLTGILIDFSRESLTSGDLKKWNKFWKSELYLNIISLRVSIMEPQPDNIY